MYEQCKCKCNYASDMHGQVHVHAGMPYKFSHYMHACFARNYPEAWSHCGHGHNLNSVAQLSLVNTADIRSAFNKTLASERFRRNAIDGVAEASMYIYYACLVYINTCPVHEEYATTA